MKKFDYRHNSINPHHRLSAKASKLHKDSVRTVHKKFMYYDSVEGELSWGRKMKTAGVNQTDDALHWCDYDINDRCKRFTGVYPE